jgi:hypothetical protein
MMVTLVHERFEGRDFIRHSSPLSHWERVGVRGYKLSIPYALTRTLRVRPLPTGEVKSALGADDGG